MTTCLLLIFAFAPALLALGLLANRWLAADRSIIQGLVVSTSILGSVSGMLLWYLSLNQAEQPWFSFVTLSQPESDGPFIVIAWTVTKSINLLLVAFYLVLGLLAFQIDPEKKTSLSIGILTSIVAIPHLVLGVGILHVGFAWLLIFLGLLMASLNTKKSNFDFLVFFAEIFFGMNLLAFATICSADALPRVSSIEYQTQVAEYVAFVNRGIPGYFELFSLSLIFVVCSRMGMMPFLNLRQSILSCGKDSKNETMGVHFEWLVRIFCSVGLLFQFETFLSFSQVSSRPPIISQTGMVLGILSMGIWFLTGMIQLSHRRSSLPSFLFAIAALGLTFFFWNLDVSKNWSLLFFIFACLIIPLSQYVVSKRKIITVDSDLQQFQFADSVYQFPSKHIPNGISWFAKQVDQFILDPTLNESQKHICHAVRTQLRWIARSSAQLSVVLMFLSVMIFLYALVLS